jgi:hypothetical protein
METPLPTNADTLRAMTEENARLVAEVDRLRTEKAVETERLKHRIRLLEKMLFGPRSERIVSSDGQLEFEGLLRELEQLNAGKRLT